MLTSAKKGKASPVVSSRKVVEVFEKRHDNVPRDIKELIVDESFGLLNFEESFYSNSQNKEQPEYLMTRLGFSVLTMNTTELGIVIEAAPRETYVLPDL